MILKIAYECGGIDTEAHDIQEYKGIRFFINPCFDMNDWENNFRASEYTTGFGIPKTFAPTRAQAVTLAKSVIDRAGSEKINHAISARPILNQ